MSNSENRKEKPYLKLGIHAYAWCSQWTNDALHLIEKVKELGLDFIEIPLMCLETFDADAVKARLESVGLDVVTSTVLLGEPDITSEDPKIKAKGVDYLNACVEATHAIGAKSFSGVIYSQHVKSLPRLPEKKLWEYSADCLRGVAQFALDLGVLIGLEPVNGYESCLINTCEQALQLKEMIDVESVKVHLDTYHMNIEEKSYYSATKLAGKDLIYYHLCENDRGIPGTGLVDWDGIFKDLAEISYKGNAALESFIDCTDNMNTRV